MSFFDHCLINSNENIYTFIQEEGDMEAFKVKKSKASLRLSAARKSVQEAIATTTTTTTEEQQSTSSAYTNELLEALRKDTPSTPAALKSTSLDNNKNIDDDDTLLAEKFPSLMKNDKSAIPDAHAIHAAKKKREQMRKGYVDPMEEDFVKLDDQESSRLVREEDDVGDDGEAGKVN